jgi:uncharacterized protein YegJ (DUF2314 family)
MIGFYVSVRDNGRSGFLLGPYATHEEALANVQLGQRLAEQVNDNAHWYAYGTAKVTAETLKEGLLNQLAKEEAA